MPAAAEKGKRGKGEKRKRGKRKKEKNSSYQLQTHTQALPAALAVTQQSFLVVVLSIANNVGVL